MTDVQEQLDPGPSRRRYERFTTAIPVRFTSEMLEFDAVVEFEEGAVKNVSRSGLFIRSDYLEVPGAPVLLILTIPASGETVRLNGYVAWIADEPPRGPGMGIRISGAPLDPCTLKRLLPISQ